MPLTLRFGGYQPERSVHTRAARALGTCLPADVQLDLTAQITTKGHAAADLLSLTEAGDLEMCYFASSYLAGRVPELSVLDLPFAGADRTALWQRLDGRAGDLIKAAVEARTGFTVLAFWDNGVRHISNGVRAIIHPRDCRGLFIRTLDSAFHQALFAALGFSPRFIDVKDLAEAVRTRSIDAQENPLTNLVNFDLHKTHRFVSLTGHFSGIALLLANRAAFGRMSPAERAGVGAAIAEATRLQRELAAREDEECLAILKADGVAVTMPEEIDRAAFAAAVAPVVLQERARLDQALLAEWQ